MAEAVSTPRPAGRSTEHGGLGQSGYTAGREHADVALRRELDSHNLEYTRVFPGDEPDYDLGTDDRWVGRGGIEPDPDRDRDDQSAPAGA